MSTETKAAWTPGPWRSERIVMSKYGLDAYFEVKGGPTEDESVGVFARDVCQTIMRNIEGESALLAEDEANARLISKAPELVEAMRKLLPFVKSHAAAQAKCFGKDCPWCLVINEAERLLAEIGG